MNKFLCLSFVILAVALAAESEDKTEKAVHQGRHHKFKKMDGVSAENWQKLKEAMQAAHPKSHEEAKPIFESWLTSLPEDEQAAAKEFQAKMQEKMKNRKEQGRKTTPTAN